MGTLTNDKLKEVENTQPQLSVDIHFQSKGGILLIVIKGEIRKSTLQKLLSCSDEITSYSPKFVVLDLDGMKVVDAFSHRDFVQFQQKIRDDFKNFTVKFRRSNYREELKNLGLVRSAEIVNSLPEALQRFGLVKVA